MPDDPFPPACVAHCADARHIDFADELSSEGCATDGVEGVPNIQMLLDKLRPRERTEIADLIVDGVNSIRADRDDDIALTGQNLRDVIVTFIAGDGLAAGNSAWPL